MKWSKRDTPKNPYIYLEYAQKFIFDGGKISFITSGNQFGKTWLMKQFKEWREDMSRFDYIKYDKIRCNNQLRFKATVETLENEINEILTGGEVEREKEYALKALEECYMWIGKALRNKQKAILGGYFELQEERNDS